MDVDELLPEVVGGFMDDYKNVREELLMVQRAYERLEGKSPDA